MATAEARIALPDWAEPLFRPARFKVLYGGRGSGKSYTVADVLLIRGTQSRRRVLCAREFQNSIRDSVHHLLAERVEALGLAWFYTVQEKTITGLNGTEFIFKGVRLNTQSIKSMSGVTDLWLEEAQTVSAKSWQVLVPTIREPDSEIFVTFNPDQESDPIYQEFVVRPPENAYVRRINWQQNPFFPDVLREEKDRMLRLDPEAYAHIWEGETWRRSDAQVLNGKWRVDEFEPAEDWDGPYHGADWGFAQDPTVLSRLWIHGRRLFIERESHHVGLELHDTGERWERDVPGVSKYVVRADNARPESISHVRSKGTVKIPKLIGAPKWSGSVEDGIAFLRSFDEIVIHARCKRAQEEARLYSYKVDQKTGDVLPQIVDAHNHCIDSWRYGLAPLIKQRERLEDLVSTSY